MCLLKSWRKPPKPPRPPRLRSRPVQQNDLHGSSHASFSSSVSLSGIKETLPNGPVVYKYREIRQATRKFSPSQQLGRSVWKGTLRGTPVAIVRKQWGVSGFKDVMTTLSSLHHANLVSLIGGCKEGIYVYLVYEFVEGAANLRECIRSRNAARFSALPSWNSRLQVALDVAKGLEYLHHATLPGFVHKGIQTTKILVTKSLRAKIANVGAAELTGEAGKGGTNSRAAQLAKEGGLDEREGMEAGKRGATGSSSVRITGTPGYMPPEYIMSGEVTSKYDVFSFGVVLLELLSGEEPVFVEWVGFPVSARSAARPCGSLVDRVARVMQEPGSRAKLRQWMDPNLRDSYPARDAYEVAQLARRCVGTDPVARPDMSDVAARLSKYLIGAQKWEAEVGASRAMFTLSLQPR